MEESASREEAVGRWKELGRQRDQVARFVRRISHDPHLAEDIAQEAILRALEGRGCPGEHDAALRWLKRTAYNLWVDARRRNAVRECQSLWGGEYPVPGEDSLGVAEREIRMEGRAVEWSWLAAELPRALRRVPDLYRGLMRDRYFRGTSFRELSRRSGLSVGNIKTRLYRGRKALVRILRGRVRLNAVLHQRNQRRR